MENRPWLKNYANGVPANIDPTRYPQLIDFIDENVKKYAHLPAYDQMGKTMTFGEIDAAATHFGAYLQSRGLRAGDRVAVMMPNLLQFPIAVFGCLRAGLIVVNTNPLYTPREMTHQFKDSGAKAIIICENFAANLQQVLSDTEIQTVIVTSIGEMLGGLKGWITNLVVRKIKKLVPAYSIPNIVSFKKALAEGQNFSLDRAKGHANDPIILQYTGGTTGISKGAALSNENLVANMMQIGGVMNPYLKEGEEVVLCALPLYHIYAFTVNCLAMLGIGGKNILITNARDIPKLVDVLKTHRFTLITGLNTLFNAMLNHPKIGEVDFSKLKITSGGGMAVQRAVAERWQKTTGCYLAEGYGMTESSPLISTNPFEAARGRLGTIGLPAPSTDVRIVGEDGSILGFDEVGEIQARGPQVMKGYWQKPEETAKVILEGGWLATGDIGLMSPDGFLKIVDRKKDMILVSGFNVYPNEIEDVVAMHPKVLEVAAVGQADEKSGEVVKIFVVKKDATLTEAELLEHCRANLTGYKMPRTIVFRTEPLPKTNVGKILRRELR